VLLLLLQWGNIMADKFRYSFDLTKKLEEQLQQSMLASGQQAVTSSPGMMSADPPAKELQEAEQSKYDPYSFIKDYKDMLFSMFGGEEEYSKVVAQQDARLPIEEDPLNKVTEPYLKIIDVPQQPPVQVEQLEPDTESTQQAIRKATEQTLGIMQIEEYLDSIKQEKAQQEPDQQGLMAKPYDELRMREENEPLGEGLVSPEAGMLRPRARPVTSITDAVTNADVVTNGKVDMNKVENVILNTIGNNIYSAGLLGAIKIEVGEGVKDERPYSLSNLENFKGAWKERSENAGLIDPKTGMATKKAKELNKQGKLGETIFNVQYANRNGNGSIESGDGNKFKGRGLIQITGRSNYEAVGKKLGVDLIANPELVNTPEYAVPAAVAYMDINGFFELEPSQITKNTLQNLVNPNASSAVKNKRWRATTGYLKNNSSDTAELDETLRPRSRPNIIMASN